MRRHRKGRGIGSSAGIGLLLATAAVSAAAGRAARAGEAVLVRDVWGVPHATGDTEADAFFALGYAQAEDRLADIYLAIRTAIGRLAEVKGESAVEQDYLMRLTRNDVLHAGYLPTAPRHLRDAVESFTAGIRAYIAEHPGEAADVALPVEPWHPLAVGRAMILRWPIGTVMDDFRNGERRQPAAGSNQWAIAPARTADGAAILLSDPHLTWEGLAVLYEARIRAAGMSGCGYYLIGSPMLAIGHNDRVGWALTTGGPDTSDVYRVRYRLAPAVEYEYDGQWRPVRTERFVIPVKGGEPVTRPAFYTHLGPVISPPDPASDTAFVAASPYFDQTGLYDQFYRMNRAGTVREAMEALALHQYNEQNVMLADVEGTIAYVRNGATPIRPVGYDWSRPVDGTTSDTAWQGIHPQADLVQIVNPPQGYMQNCNVSPATMMVDSPLTPDRYLPYVFNVSWDQDNPRGRRALELLAADDSVTREEAMAYALDVFDRLAPRWQAELRAALDAADPAPAPDAPLRRAAEAILTWDGAYTPEATATVAFKFWRLACGGDAECELAPLGRGEPLSPATRVKLLGHLDRTVAMLTERYGRWDVPWGEVHVVGRDGRYFPCGGADYQSGDREANFSETLFDVRGVEDPQRPGRFIANNGSMAMILMFFEADGVRSFTCTPWGQSGHADSPHHVDQAEKLFSPRRMKPTWSRPEDLGGHVESTRRFSVTPDGRTSAVGPPHYPDHTALLVVRDEQDRERPISTPADWEVRRDHILANFARVAGPLPGGERRVPLEPRVLSATDEGSYVRRHVDYAVEPGDRGRAWLLVPQDIPAGGSRAGIVALHQTTRIGKDEPAGVGGLDGLHYGAELARRGHVVICPDYHAYGERQVDPYALGWESATMKGIWDHMRAVDLLVSLPEVDPGRIAAIGHSLGGHNAIFLAVFDQRVRAVVSSCGYNAFPFYMRGDLTGWSHGGYMPRLATEFAVDPRRVPFDWPELVAAVAPRGLYTCGPTRDDNFAVEGVRVCERAARPVYELLGAGDRLVYSYPEATHEFPAHEREAAYRFLEARFRDSSGR